MQGFCEEGNAFMSSYAYAQNATNYSLTKYAGRYADRSRWFAANQYHFCRDQILAYSLSLSNLPAERVI